MSPVMMKAKSLLALAGLVALCTMGAAQAATITIVNVDGPGEGFNDPTPVAPLNSNPGTTLGAQRLNVFQKAADQWGALLTSSVEIRVRAAFNPLACSGTSAVLGAAGATAVFRDFANAPRPATWYSVALANAISGTDLNGNDPGQEEINSQFNVDIDNGTCLTGVAGWYYGTDPTLDPPPSDRTALLPVVFHELAHGLGFQTFTSVTTGALLSGFPDAWTRFLADASTLTTWRDMTSDAQRQASAISDPNLVWLGPNVTVDKELFLANSPAFVINTPAAIAGSFAAQSAAFGPAVPPAGVTGEIVAALPELACTPLTNPGAVAGKIALVDRGTCNFTAKVANAQAAGAVAVVVANNVATGLPGMGGADATITIPSYGVSQAVGNSIRGALAGGTVNGTLGFSAERAGTNRGFVRMNAPNPVQPGSSVSHFTSDAFPNLLMEPSLTGTIFDEVDLTIALFRDIGWRDVAPPGIQVFSDAFEP